jgi:hypothetical protein
VRFVPKNDGSDSHVTISRMGDREKVGQIPGKRNLGEAARRELVLSSPLDRCGVGEGGWYSITFYLWGSPLFSATPSGLLGSIRTLTRFGLQK